MPETIDGIPVHPLLVHAPVVLIPLAALFVVAWVLVPAWRARLRWFVIGFVGLAWLTTLLAGSSGETLAESIRETSLVEEHEELAEGLETFVWVLFLSTVAGLSIERWGERLAGMRRPFAIIAAAAMLVGAGGAVVFDVLAGHAGAKASWDGYETR